MTQDQVVLLCFKVVEIASVVTIGAFIAYYSKAAAWWSNPIGRTIVIKDIAIILVLLPSILSIFFHFSRLTSHIAAWFDIGSFALVPAVICWRIVVFRKIHQAGGSASDGNDGRSLCRCDSGMDPLVRRRTFGVPGTDARLAYDPERAAALSAGQLKMFS